MTVWKIGSRWSNYGSSNAKLVRIFLRSNVIFNGKAANNFIKCQKDDYFAIADGYKIVAVAKAISDRMSLRDMFDKHLLKIKRTDTLNGVPAEEELRVAQDTTYGFRVKIVDLVDKNLQFEYKKRGAFFSANSISKKVIELYETEGHSQFDIISNTYTLAGHANNKKSILGSNTTYIIPIYQREYSWGDEQVGRFIHDILNGYLLREPMFIGTMQLSTRKYVAKNEYMQDVIDGQQRLSTFLCLLKYLSLKYPQLTSSHELHFDWLETQVNNGKENERLQELINIKSMESLVDDDVEKRNNKYIQNTTFIANYFEESLYVEDSMDNLEFSPKHFIDYVFRSIYFVVIETIAGLSKTIQIFNTINTAGLDLSGDDLFKIRFFEYLKDIKQKPDSIFDDISQFYGKVKEINEIWHKEGHNNDIVSISEIRSIYKDYIISRFNLKKDLFSMATNTFFEHLFDHLLHVQDYSADFGKQNIHNINLDLDDLHKILAVEEQWNRHIHDFDTYEQLISWCMFNYTPYRNYRKIVYHVFLTESDNKAAFEKSHRLLSILFRIAYCESIKYARIINYNITLFQNFYKRIYQEGVDSVIIFAKETLSKILSPENKIEKYIGREIFEQGKCHRTWGNLICVLSAYLDEIIDNNISIHELTCKLFFTHFDIEHIHATANMQECIGISNEMQNSIGNLMLLEYDINRSIGNIPFSEKISGRKGRLSYKKSQFATVKKIVAENEVWEINQIQKRKQNEINKIKAFLEHYECF